MDDKELTVQQAADLTGYSLRHVRRLASEGTVKARRVGVRVFLIDRQSLLAYARRMDDLGTEKHANGG